MLAYAKHLIRQIRDFLIPPLCPGCRTVVMQDYNICQTCWPHIRFITDPLCQTCGMPFEFILEQEVLCGTCIQKAPPYEKGRSVLAYNDLSKKLILPFKHGDATYLAQWMAHWSFRRYPSLFQDIDYIVPVPLHWKRLAQRQYNQAALFARCLSKLTNVLHQPLSLKRAWHTDSQEGKNLEERRENVSTAFVVEPADAFKGKSVLLVDDVFTTGATIEACCQALRRSGVHRIHVLTFARVLRARSKH